MNSEAAFASENVRSRKNCIGSIGAGARSSHATNAAVRTAPTASAPPICGEPQPSVFARTRPQTIPNRPLLASARPGRSKRPGPRLSSSRSSTSGTRAIPIGTFSQKTQCQLMPSTTAPPTSGPKAIARPLIPPQAPRASPRFSAGTDRERTVSVSGITIAPPRPCTARAASSAPIVGASAAAALARVKMLSPSASRRRRPKRSPSAAPVSSSTAKVREHALDEEDRDEVGLERGNALDVRDEVAVAGAYHGADLGIVAGRVGLHLELEPLALGQQPLDVGIPHRIERLLAALALRRPLEHLERLAEAAGDDRLEELLLRPEEPEDVRLGDARAACDALGPEGGEHVVAPLDLDHVGLPAVDVALVCLGQDDGQVA